MPFFLSLPLGLSLCLPADSSAERNNIVKIGVASVITPVDAVKYYQDVIDYIGEQIGQPVQMVHRRTYDEMDSLLEKGEVKLAFICSAPYVNNREQFGIELLVAPCVHGSTKYHSYIIANPVMHVIILPALLGNEKMH